MRAVKAIQTTQFETTVERTGTNGHPAPVKRFSYDAWATLQQSWTKTDTDKGDAMIAFLETCPWGDPTAAIRMHKEA